MYRRPLALPARVHAAVGKLEELVGEDGSSCRLDLLPVLQLGEQGLLKVVVGLKGGGAHVHALNEVDALGKVEVVLGAHVDDAGGHERVDLVGGALAGRELVAHVVRLKEPLLVGGHGAAQRLPKVDQVHLRPHVEEAVGRWRPGQQDHVFSPRHHTPHCLKTL